MAPRTLSAHLSAIRSLYRWMAAEGIVEGDAVSAIASPKLPRVGALGALVGYATDPATVGYQPMHVNFGLVPPLEDGKRRSKRDRYQAYADRALEALDAYLASRSDLFGGDRS